MKYIYFPQLYLSLYLCIPQITKFTHPKALQLHSKPEDVLDLRASGWEDNKVVITPEFAGSAVLLRLYGFLFFFADPSIYRISQYEPDDFMTTLRQPKNWKRQESLVTSREEVGDPRHMSFIRGCLIFGTFYGGKFSNAVTYKFVFWNILKPYKRSQLQVLPLLCECDIRSQLV